ncbi:MAG: hypothetical protein WBD87_05245 [Candidatus Acidiferrales bacterium]
MVERDGQEDRFHRIVIALISRRLNVATDTEKEAVEILLVFSPQGATKFRPPFGSLFDKLAKRRNRAAHV